MNFFIQIHRSITDPSFYTQVVAFPVRKIVFFILKLLLLTALVMSISHTMRVINPVSGLPAILPLLFPGMVVTSEGMYSNTDAPYIPNRIYLADFIATYIDIPASTLDIPDSLVLVDCRKNIGIDKNSSVLFLLAADSIHVRFSPDISLTLPYSNVLSNEERITLTPAGVGEFLGKRRLIVARNFFIQHFVLFGVTVAVSIFFLSVAAAMLKRREQNLRTRTPYVKIASFAITPIAVQNILVALSGVKTTWLWYVAIGISTFILFRALNHLASIDKEMNIRRTWES